MKHELFGHFSNFVFHKEQKDLMEYEDINIENFIELLSEKSIDRELAIGIYKLYKAYNIFLGISFSSDGKLCHLSRSIGEKYRLVPETSNLFEKDPFHPDQLRRILAGELKITNEQIDYFLSIEKILVGRTTTKGDPLTYENRLELDFVDCAVAFRNLLLDIDESHHCYQQANQLGLCIHEMLRNENSSDELKQFYTSTVKALPIILSYYSNLSLLGK